MKKKDENNIEKHLIDEFYNEDTSQNKFMEDEALNEFGDDFKNKMNDALNLMDTVNEFEPDFDLNIMEIIKEAEVIENKKVTKLELLGFILSAFSIFSCGAFITLKLGIKFLIYTQIGAVYILPLILIPISKHILNKEG